MRRLLVALVFALLAVVVPATTALASPTYVYDAPSIARVDLHAIGAIEAGSTQLSDGREAPASPSVDARRAFTTFLTRSIATNTAPARFIDAGGTVIDRSSIRTAISTQRQGRHIVGDPLYNGGSYFNAADDAQRVLDDFHSGAAEVLGIKGNDIVVRTSNVTGFNHNPGAGFPNQPTNVFFIKGSSSPSVVPYNPTWAP